MWKTIHKTFTEERTPPKNELAEMISEEVMPILLRWPTTSVSDVGK